MSRHPAGAVPFHHRPADLARLGVFNLTFFFLLFMFFFLDSSMSQYAIFPIAGVLATSISVINFILFINHAIRWMQVSSITTSLKDQSKFRLLNPLVYDLEPYRPGDPDQVPHVPIQGSSHAVASDRSGFLQVIDYGRLIQEARWDGIVLEMDRRMGDFVMEGIALFHYWKTTDHGDQPIDEKKYHQLTAQEVVYQLTDLLLAVSNVIQFTPYLMDEDERVRMIMKDEEFVYYVYASYAVIVMYAEENPVLTNSVLEDLVILSKAVRREDQPVCWRYGLAIAENFQRRLPYDYDQLVFVNHPHELATITG